MATMAHKQPPVCVLLCAVCSERAARHLQVQGAIFFQKASRRKVFRSVQLALGSRTPPTATATLIGQHRRPKCRGQSTCSILLHLLFSASAACFDRAQPHFIPRTCCRCSLVFLYLLPTNLPASPSPYAIHSQPPPR